MGGWILIQGVNMGGGGIADPEPVETTIREAAFPMIIAALDSAAARRLVAFEGMTRIMASRKRVDE